jgi:hypothetical protein
MFFLADIFTNLRRCHLQLDNFNIFTFISKIWPINPRDGCEPSSNLVELIENYLDFKKELEEFEIHLNIMKLWTYEMLEDFYFF